MVSMQDQIMRHVAQLSGLNPDNLSDAERKALRRDAGLLHGYAVVACIRDQKEVAKGVAAIRKHLDKARHEAGRVSELLPAEPFQPIIEQTRLFREQIEPALQVAEAKARLLDQKQPRARNRNDALQAMANCAAEIFKERTGDDPKPGKETSPGSRQYDSDFPNFVQRLLDSLPQKGTRRGARYLSERLLPFIPALRDVEWRDGATSEVAG